MRTVKTLLDLILEGQNGPSTEVGTRGFTVSCEKLEFLQDRKCGFTAALCNVNERT